MLMNSPRFGWIRVLYIRTVMDIDRTIMTITMNSLYQRTFNFRGLLFVNKYSTITCALALCAKYKFTPIIPCASDMYKSELLGRRRRRWFGFGERDYYYSIRRTTTVSNSKERLNLVNCMRIVAFIGKSNFQMGFLLDLHNYELPPVWSALGWSGDVSSRLWIIMLNGIKRCNLLRCAIVDAIRSASAVDQLNRQKQL